MKISCPSCESELIEAKLFQVLHPMECPDCNKELEFKINTASYIPLLISMILIIMGLNSFNIINDMLYQFLLAIGLVIILVVIVRSKIIAREIKKYSNPY